MIESSPWSQGTKWTEPPKKVGREWRERYERREEERWRTHRIWSTHLYLNSNTLTLEHYTIVYQTTWSPLLLTPSSDQAIKPNLSNSFELFSLSIVYFHASFIIILITRTDTDLTVGASLVGTTLVSQWTLMALILILQVVSGPELKIVEFHLHNLAPTVGL